MIGIRLRLVSYLAAVAALKGLAQTPAEVSSQDTPIMFQSRVNLVLVPAVVRDRAGNPVGTLRQQDFQLFDNGMPQVIQKFTVEKSEGKPAQPVSATDGTAGERTPEERSLQGDASAITPPDHFVSSESFGGSRESHYSMHHGPHAQFVAVDSAHLRQSDPPGFRQLFQCVVGDVTGVNTMESFQEPVHHPPQLLDDAGKSLQRPAAGQFFGIVNDRLNAEIYEPALAATRDAKAPAKDPPAMAVSVQVLDAKTGQVTKDLGTSRIPAPASAGNSAVPLAMRLPIGDLPVGAYQLKVTGLDETGHQSTRTANLEIVP